MNCTNTSSFHAGNSSSTTSGSNYYSLNRQNTLRKTSFLHRTTGRNFYGWAVQVLIIIKNIKKKHNFFF